MDIPDEIIDHITVDLRTCIPNQQLNRIVNYIRYQEWPWFVDESANLDELNPDPIRIAAVARIMNHIGIYTSFFTDKVTQYLLNLKR
jgi:hypothetical protein